MRATAFVIRHQRFGFDLSCIYAVRPSDDVVEARGAVLSTSAGQGWARVEEVLLEVPGAVPDGIFTPYVEPVQSVSAGTVQAFTTEGTGHVYYPFGVLVDDEGNPVEEGP